MIDVDLSEKLEEQKNRIDWAKWAGIKLVETDELLLLLLQEHEKYRKLREQKCLIELPCGMNDTVYVIGTVCLAGQEPVNWCDTCDCDDCVYDKEYIVFPRDMNTIIIGDLIGYNDYPYYKWNENTFSTKEEAEEHLKLTKNKENNHE